jgi:cytochrome c556
MKIINLHGSPAVIMLLSACPAQVHPSPPALRAVASIQELMQEVIDPSADGVWDAVETTLTKEGETVQQPRTDAQWLEVRRSAITLAESANLLVIEGRRVGVRDFPAEATGALDSAHIQDLIAAQRPAFNAFAAALREAALTTLSAIDAQDPARLVMAGGAVDQVCEGCHLRFWYPNQVIPPIR